MQVWINRQVLSAQTSDSSAFLNAMCLLMYVLNREQNFLYFNPDYPTSELTVTGLAWIYCLKFRENPSGGSRLATRLSAVEPHPSPVSLRYQVTALSGLNIQTWTHLCRLSQAGSERGNTAVPDGFNWEVLSVERGALLSWRVRACNELGVPTSQPVNYLYVITT
jgi:hypothetical protein